MSLHANNQLPLTIEGSNIGKISDTGYRLGQNIGYRLGYEIISCENIDNIGISAITNSCVSAKLSYLHALKKYCMCLQHKLSYYLTTKKEIKSPTIVSKSFFYCLQNYKSTTNSRSKCSLNNCLAKVL